jgi:hypothetical protein
MNANIRNARLSAAICAMPVTAATVRAQTLGYVPTLYSSRYHSRRLGLALESLGYRVWWAGNFRTRNAAQ